MMPVAKRRKGCCDASFFRVPPVELVVRPRPNNECTVVLSPEDHGPIAVRPRSYRLKTAVFKQEEHGLQG